MGFNRPSNPFFDSVKFPVSDVLPFIFLHKEHQMLSEQQGRRRRRAESFADFQFYFASTSETYQKCALCPLVCEVCVKKENNHSDLKYVRHYFVSWSIPPPWQDWSLT